MIDINKEITTKIIINIKETPNDFQIKHMKIIETKIIIEITNNSTYNKSHDFKEMKIKFQ